MMRTAFLLACAVLIAGSSMASADAGADIARLEKDFNAAYAANDLDKYFGYYADDATLWFPEGRTDVPSYRKMWTAYIRSGAQLQAATLSDYQVKLSPQGDTAIASYLLHVKTVEANKKVSNDVYQETDVWFKTAGTWKVTHVHYSSVPRPVVPRPAVPPPAPAH